MKKTGLIIAGFVLAVASLVLVFLDYRMIAAFVGFIAFMFGGVATKVGSAKWKVWLHLFIAVAFGYSLCPKGGFFCMAALTFFMTLVMSARLLFFEAMGHTKYKWFEPFFLTVAVGYYVIGNLYDGIGWMSWSLPAPGLAFTAFGVLGKFVEGKAVAAGAIEKYGVEIGKPAPPFSLPDQKGNVVNLSDYKGKRHVLLIFVRGDWCPTCHIMLRSYEKNKERFAAKNIMLLAIGPDNVEVNKEMVEKLNLDYKLLSDSKFEAVRSYGMQLHPNNPMTKYAEGIPLPASFLVDINGIIQYTSNPKIAGQVLNPETIIPIVDNLKATA